MARGMRQVRRTSLTLLSCVAAAAMSACTGQATELETARKACRELSALAEPYSMQSETAPFDLLRPTNPPRQWREDAEAMKEAAEPLLDFDGTEVSHSRLPEFGRRWVALAEYLTRSSRDPERYDIDVASGLLYPAEGICSDAIEEAA